MKAQVTGSAALVRAQAASGSSTSSLTLDHSPPASFFFTKRHSRRFTCTSSLAPAWRVPSGATATTSTPSARPASAKPRPGRRAPA